MSPLRKQGPSTTGSRVARKSSNSVSQNAGRGVWVPAFAGTTMVVSPRQILQQITQRRRGEDVHVGEPVAAAGLQRHGGRLRTGDADAAMAGGGAIAVAGRPG